MNDTDPIAPSGSPICTPTPPGASGEMRNAPLDTSEADLQVLQREWEAIQIYGDQMGWTQELEDKQITIEGKMDVLQPPKLASGKVSDR